MTASLPAAPRSVPRFLSIKDIAARLGMSTKTVRRWIDAGELPVHRLGRQLRVSENDLDLFLHQNRH